ncbi:MAG: TRAP-type transport system periplasmic protein [Rhodospirillaceae bacterium]|jgi:TRAP-type C4-dicarboxylate transport system substrate-binding protein|nr:TRAP-type transport system periplasmic protein [Rhodospirillaceae bacterium]
MLHKAIKSVAGAALAGSLLSLSPSASAQTTLTMSSWVPPNHHLTKVVLEGFADELEKASAGRIKFQMLQKHPVAPSATFDAVRDGLVDVSFITASYTPDRLLLPLVAEFPGAGETAEITSVAYSRLHRKYLDGAGEYKGVHLIAVFTHGPGQLFNTRRPIERLADLEGMKLRTGGSVAEAMARALGASVVVNPVNPNARTDNRELLTAGLADGVLFPQDAIVSFGLDGVVKYATLFPGGLFNFSFGFVMNQDKWDKLAKQDQELLTRFGSDAFARRAGKSWDNADRLGNEGMKKAGVRFDTANQTFIKEIQVKAQPIIQNWINEVKEKRNMDGATLLREFDDELKRVAAGE